MNVKSDALNSKLGKPKLDIFERGARKVFGVFDNKLARTISGRRMKDALKVRDRMNQEDKMITLKKKYNIK